MQKTPPSIGLQVVLMAFIRLVTNISIRFLYPFLPIFASQLGVPVTRLALALTARTMLVTLNPLAASAITDRRGRKTGMLVGLGLYSLANLAVVIWPVFWVLFAMLAVSMFGQAIFLAAMQSYLADNIPYERRGRALAFTEIAWSSSYFLGMPVIGFLLARSGWVSPFLLLAGTGGLSFALVAKIVPRTPPPLPAPKSNLTDLRRVLTSPPAVVALLMGLCFSAGNEILNVVFGVWMKGTFGLEIVGLGLASTIIGIAELTGESTTALIVDRVGKERSIRIGLLVNTTAVVMLLFLGSTWISALAVLFFYSMAYEFMMVSTLPLMSEIMPEERATMLGLMVSFFSFGRGISALVGLQIYALGFPFIILTIVVINLIAFFLLNHVRVTGEQSAPSSKPSEC